MRGTYRGTYVVRGEAWCVCPTQRLPDGEYKRLGDTGADVWLLKSVVDGKRFLLAPGDERKLEWKEGE
ncbi:MAG: hypothetical protein ACYSWO_24270 [Planctomycetota bacterium]|jgi:hypothetical protein